MFSLFSDQPFYFNALLHAELLWHQSSEQGSAQVPDDFWGRLGREAELQNRGQNAKGCEESMFLLLHPSSLLCFDSGPLSLLRPLEIGSQIFSLPLPCSQSIHHTAAGINSVKHKNVIILLKRPQ